MADASITQLTPYTTPQVSDVFPIVDVSMGITKKISLSVLDTFITNNISALDASKIANGTVSNTEFQYLDGVTSSLQTQISAKQATLVSGTNIKTINSTSLLGSGNISISSSPAGSNGYVQYNNSGVFGADQGFQWNGTYMTLGYPGPTLYLSPSVGQIAFSNFTSSAVIINIDQSTVGDGANFIISSQGGAMGFNNGMVGVSINNGSNAFFDTSVLASDRTFAFPDASGTLAISAGATGGSGSAGAGKQYVPINVGGVIYKVLHDGII